MRDRATEVAEAIFAAYADFRQRFAEITTRAAGRFTERDWRGLQEDASERLDVYSDGVGAAVSEVQARSGEAVNDRDLWSRARNEYTRLVGDRPEVEIATTFFNSVTRRIFDTVGVDEAIEFLDVEATLPDERPDTRVFSQPGDIASLLAEMLASAGFETPWQNLHRDVQLAEDEVLRHLDILGLSPDATGGELLTSIFYRGQGAYLVGRLYTDSGELPLCVAVHNTIRGLVIGAVLMEQSDISVLFSYTRSSFSVICERPIALVAYLGSLMPHKKASELYSAIGYHKHGKTELYRDFLRHVASTDDQFEIARGARGLVMVVFTMPGYDVVFKVIRDRFPFPKQTTRRQIMSKYRLVFRHDRAGRLIDAQEFEHLRFDRNRFSHALIDELAAEAGKTVTIGPDHVTLHHVYVERRVIPLDVYVREVNPVKAQAAIVDYGRAIKNLASSNIFPGDMLLKNFGVTRSGRVVFYDYDELMLLTDCNFRTLPDSNDPADEMAADPWFGVGDNDVFPEEFVRFLGIREELRDAFLYAHGDIFGTRFWKRTQDRIAGGEVIEIFPYQRNRRLGANVRRRRERAS